VISVFSNDPASPHNIKVLGDARTPRLSLVMANTGNFGKVCAGSFADESLILSNSGRCMLTVTSIVSSSPEFLPPQVSTYPLSIAAGGFLPAPIRFEPAGLGPKSATLTVHSDDPSGPRSIAVSGDAPAGKLTVTGSALFGGVCCRHREQRTLTLCNTGGCSLHVSHVGLKHKRRHLRLINNPFPAVIRPGSCLSVVIQYFADEAGAETERVDHPERRPARAGPDIGRGGLHDLGLLRQVLPGTPPRNPVRNIAATAARSTAKSAVTMTKGKTTRLERIRQHRRVA